MLSRGAAAVAAGAMLAVSAPADAAESVTLTGTYRRMAKEVVVGATPSHAYDDLLVTRERTYRLRLRGTKPRPNATVQVSALSSGDGYSVTSYRTLAAPPAAPLGPTRTLAILAYWTAPDAMTKEKAAAQLFTDGNNYVRENSYGASTLSGSVTPWVRIAAPTNGRCYDYADQILFRARDAAYAIGYSYTSFHRTLVYFPRCSGSDTASLTGWAYEPGDSIWMNGVMDRRTAMHEHGHSYGMGHARALSCTGSAGRVTLSETCTAHEYGDPFDAMGQSGYAAHFSGPHKDEVGWLGSRKRVMTSSSGTYTLAPFERSSTNPLVVVAHSQIVNRTYWLEYRQPLGFDARLPAGATAGVTIRMRDPQFGPGPYLLDPTPSDASFTTAVLGAGRSWTAPDGLRVSVGSVTTSGATVTVSGARPLPVAPSAPRSLTATAGDARVLLKWAEPLSSGNVPISHYSVSYPGGNLQAYPGNLSALVTWLQNDSPYTFSVRAVNSAGPGPAATVTATPRESPPTVAITSPAEGATIDGSWTASASVAPGPYSLAPLVEVVWYVDGQYRGGREPGSPFSFSTLDLANGEHTLRVEAYDENGRMGSDAVTFTVLNLRPTASILAPGSYDRVTGGVVTLKGDARPAEDGTPIDRVEFSDPVYGTSYGVDREAPYEVPWDVTFVPDGYRYLRVRAVDAKGRVAESATRTFSVWHRSPTVTSVGPSTSSVRGTTMTLTADVAPGTPGVPIDRVEFSGINGTVVVDRTAPYSADFDISTIRGSRDAYVRVYETSGRNGYVSRWYTIDNPLPSVAISAPSYHAGLRTKAVTVSGTAAPNTGGAPLTTVDVTTAGVTRSVTPAADGTWSTVFDVTGRYGAQTLTATAVDTAGYRATATSAYTLYRPEPTVTGLAPAAGATLTEAPTDLTATVTLPADAVTTVSGVSFLYAGQRKAAQREADGTWAVRGVSLPAGRYTITVRVEQSDGHWSDFSSGGPVSVYAAPHPVRSAGVSPYDDATVHVTWAPQWNDAYRAPTAYVVRDDTGAEVARTEPDRTWVTVLPARTGVFQKFTVEAVNQYGTSPRVTTNGITPMWRADLVELSYTPSTTTYPARVTARARALRSDGTPVPGAVMSVIAMPVSFAGMPVRFAMPPAGADGRSTLSFTPSFTADLTVELAGGVTYYGGETGLGRVTVYARVEGNLTSARIPLGRATGFNGGVRAPTPGRGVALQRYYNGAWRTVMWRNQDSLGRVSFPFTPNARGTYTYRLAYGGDMYRSGNVSPARVLTVY